MNKTFFSITALLFFQLFFVSNLSAGYSRDPWGSRTWTGPGRPPHWSPKPEGRGNHNRPGRPIAPGKPDNPDNGIRPPHSPPGQGGYWRDEHDRYHYHKRRRRGIIYYREPGRVETVIIEREKKVPVYIPVPSRRAKQLCGGKTITRKDPTTGNLIIEYVTGATDCR